jgi:hypothetical protein
MIANELIDAAVKHPRFKEALEELATHELTQIGSPTIAMTMLCALDAGDKRVRISIAMIDADDDFDADEE